MNCAREAVESKTNSIASNGRAARSAAASHGGVSPGRGSTVAGDLHGAPRANDEALVRTLHRDVGDEVAEVVLIRARHRRRRRNRELVAEALLLRQLARLETRDVMRHDDRLAVVVLGRVGDVVLHDGRLSCRLVTTFGNTMTTMITMRCS